MVLYVGLDLSRKRIDWQALWPDGAECGAGAVPPDREALVRFAARLRPLGDALVVIESMTGARFVHDTLEQLGWDPRWALTVSLALRTSYHVYYGLGFLVTIPFGYYATRSFQKHRRLARPIFAHFLYDAVLITISVLAA